MKTKIRQIERELEAANDYIHCAAKSEGNERDVYKSLASDELGHAEKLMRLCEKMHHDDEKAKAWKYLSDVFKDQIIQLKTKYQLID